MRRGSRIRLTTSIFALSTIVVLGLVACTGDNGGTGGVDSNDSDAPGLTTHSHSAAFEAALREATTDFERAILEDGVITAEEYLEAKNRQIECIRGFGLSAELEDVGAGMYQIQVSGSGDADLVDAAMDDCAKGTVLVIEPLYVSTLTNPEDRDLYELLAECLVAVGFVEEPFTAADYLREQEVPGYIGRIMDDPEASKCQVNPSYHLGSGSQ